jgi:hypothetical protein
MPKGSTCTKEYYPNQGDGKGSEIESYGSPGEKIGAGGGAPSGVQYNTAEQASNASAHGRPAVSENPSNTTGSLDDHADNPTKAEGSTSTV